MKFTNLSLNLLQLRIVHHRRWHFVNLSKYSAKVSSEVSWVKSFLEDVTRSLLSSLAFIFTTLILILFLPLINFLWCRNFQNIGEREREGEKDRYSETICIRWLKIIPFLSDYCLLRKRCMNLFKKV